MKIAPIADVKAKLSALLSFFLQWSLWKKTLIRRTTYCSTGCSKSCAFGVRYVAYAASPPVSSNVSRGIPLHEHDWR